METGLNRGQVTRFFERRLVPIPDPTAAPVEQLELEPWDFGLSGAKDDSDGTPTPEDAYLEELERMLAESQQQTYDLPEFDAVSDEKEARCTALNSLRIAADMRAAMQDEELDEAQSDEASDEATDEASDEATDEATDDGTDEATDEATDDSTDDGTESEEEDVDYTSSEAEISEDDEDDEDDEDEVRMPWAPARHRKLACQLPLILTAATTGDCRRHSRKR